MHHHERQLFIVAALKFIRAGAGIGIILTVVIGLSLITSTDQQVGTIAVFSYGIALIVVTFIMVVGVGASSGHLWIAELIGRLDTMLTAMLTGFEQRITRHLMLVDQRLNQHHAAFTAQDERLAVAEEQIRRLLGDQAAVVEALTERAEQAADDLHPRRDRQSRS